MLTDTIKWGETYDISAQPVDADGEALVLDGTWSAAVRFVRGEYVGGEEVVSPEMTIAEGAATCTIDTGETAWSPGSYVYDTRFTDPDGNDYWSEPVLLVLENRNTPAST